MRRIQILQFTPGGVGSSALLEGAFDCVAEAGNPQLKVRVADVRIDQAQYEKSICDSTLELIRAWRREPALAPEGLIVTDDIAMRAVALALVQSGFGVEKVLPIVCQASEGIEHHYGVPVARYEYQLGEAARTLINLLSLRMRDKPLPKLPVMISGILR